MLIQFCLRGLESLGKRVQPIWGEPYVFVFFRLLVLFVDSSLAVVLLLWFLFLGSSVFCASASLLLRCFVYTGELLLCFFAFCILRSLSAQSTMRVSRRAGNTRQQEDQPEEERQLRRRSRRKRTKKKKKKRKRKRKRKRKKKKKKKNTNKTNPMINIPRRARQWQELHRLQRDSIWFLEVLCPLNPPSSEVCTAH